MTVLVNGAIVNGETVMLLHLPVPLLGGCNRESKQGGVIKMKELSSMAQAG